MPNHLKKMQVYSIFFLFMGLGHHLIIGATSTTELPQQSPLETYIVHVEPPTSAQLLAQDQQVDLDSYYYSFLPTTTTTTESQDAAGSHMVYSYHNVFTGFAAKLSAQDVEQMQKKAGFISAQKEESIPLHITHSPNFLGLNQNMGFWEASNYGRGVIIGVLDSGITPDHPSFSDEGMPPPPAKWKGQCEFSSKSLCNNKIIGARNFLNVNEEPFDTNGHGTHTASTAAGNYVSGANVYGNANGTAVGIAPLAHLAVYKVCNGRCSESGILAAMDAAIDDGVDILSLSLGGPSKPFYTDNAAIGAFAAMEKGILVSCSAGNLGPSHRSLSNEAPWILTVGASSIDRKIKASAVLGNNEQFEGQSAFQPKDFSASTLLPLIYPGQSDQNAFFCLPGSLNSSNIQGKIVICSGGGPITDISKGQNVKAAGGAAMIIANPENQGYTTLSDPHVLPATHLSYADGLKVIEYLKSTSSPTATISFQGTIIGDSNAPAVGYFSSRGPNRASAGILKPDILGPGVNILAAWHRSVENNVNTKSNFNIISGTSMSCPHLSGVSALLKSAHPNWSPAAIRSAIITTADVLNLANKPIEDQRLAPADIYATGAGHVNPSRANDPGLIYDLAPEDYVPYLCGLGYTDQQVGILLKRSVTCNDSKIPQTQLNYPSFSVVFGSSPQTYTRTVTNVGEATSTYTVKIVQPPEGINISVKPTILNFSELNQKMTYEVTFDLLTNPGGGVFADGSITWTSAKHSVQSPVVLLIA